MDIYYSSDMTHLGPFGGAKVQGFGPGLKR